MDESRKLSSASQAEFASHRTPGTLCAAAGGRIVDHVMAVYRTTFPIDASSEVVWGVLVDFGRYSEWNSSLPSIAGDCRVGSTVSMTLAMPGRPSAKVKAELTEVVPQQRLVWHGQGRG